jgi:hypothetical protein
MTFIHIDNSPLARAFTKPWYPALGNARDGATLQPNCVHHRPAIRLSAV